LVNHTTKYQIGGFHIWWDSEIAARDEKSVLDGFHIQVAVDPRWTFDNDDGEFFLAKIFTDDSVLVGVPACEYDFLYNIDGFSEVSECVYKEMDEFRNSIVPNVKKFKKVPMMWYLLKFPPRPGMTGVRLSVREIFQSDDLTDDTSLDLSYFPTSSVHRVCGKYITWWATWNVVCHDTGTKQGDRKRGAPDLTAKRSKAAQQAAAFTAALYGTGNTDSGTDANIVD
jgi:hypothetical protein